LSRVIGLYDEFAALHAYNDGKLHGIFTKWTFQWNTSNILWSIHL